MTDQLARTNGITAIVACLLQVVTTFEALFVTASEYDPASMVWLSLALDAGLFVATAAIFVQFLGSPPATPWRALALPLTAVACVLSLLQVVIRFTSDHGWWTGHLNYALS
jgi:hypothetical protein